MVKIKAAIHIDHVPKILEKTALRSYKRALDGAYVRFGKANPMLRVMRMPMHKHHTIVKLVRAKSGNIVGHIPWIPNSIIYTVMDL